jgi:hypothetical protein
VSAELRFVVSHHTRHCPHSWKQMGGSLTLNDAEPLGHIPEGIYEVLETLRLPGPALWKCEWCPGLTQHPDRSEVSPQT